MNKRNALLMAGMAFVLGAVAAPLTPEQALNRVRTAGPAKLRAKVAATAKPIYTKMTEAGQPAAYVFNTTSGGFMILSGDDIAYPMLGYSDDSNVDPNNLSPEFVYWMGEYARQIEWASALGATPAREKASEEKFEAIKPLMSTKWNQDTPYNDQCPKDNGVLTYTGCVATAMAQVMNYHKYPEVGQGTQQYSPTSLAGRKLTLNFSKQAFDWNNMLPEYISGEYNETQSAAVAYLMKACGFAVEMNYGTNASGASAMSISKGLIDYLKYDKNTHSELRVIYSTAEWRKLIYDNLKNIGPVIINGVAPLQGGHSFVCDGYDGNGYFHFNWGWGGVSDGFYALEALNPDAQGIGGFAGGFNFSQNAIIGMQPDKGNGLTVAPRIFQYGTSIATIDGKTLTFDVEDYTPLGWGNASDFSISCITGVECKPIDGTSGDTQYIQGKMGNVEIVKFSNGNTYYMADKLKPNVTLPTLKDGKYRVTLVSRDANDADAAWLPFATPWGYKNYVDVKVSGGVYTVENVAVDYIDIKNLEVITECYAGKNLKMKATMSNNSDTDLWQGVCPMLFNAQGQQVFTGESVLVNVNAHETTEMEWVTKFLTSAGTTASVSKATEYTLRLYNPINQKYYDVETKITLNPAPSTTTLMLTGIEIEGASKREADVLGQHFLNLADPANLNDFNVNIKLKVSRGFYDGKVMVNIRRQNPNQPNSSLPFIDDVYNVMPFLAQGEQKDLVVNVSEKDLVKGVVYFIQVVYSSGNSQKQLASLPFMTDGEGVHVIDAEYLEDAEYYTPQGVKIANPQPGQLVIVKKGNQSFKLIWK